MRYPCHNDYKMSSLCPESGGFFWKKKKSNFVRSTRATSALATPAFQSFSLLPRCPFKLRGFLKRQKFQDLKKIILLRNSWKHLIVVFDVRQASRVSSSSIQVNTKASHAFNGGWTELWLCTLCLNEAKLLGSSVLWQITWTEAWLVLLGLSPAPGAIRNQSPDATARDNYT